MNKKYLDTLNNRYGIIRSIGRGEFGEVWLAHDNKKDVYYSFEFQNMEVAIKQAVKAELEKAPKRQELFQTEKKIMQMIDNENVIKLLDHFETKEKHYLVMDYCNQGDLDSYVKQLKIREKRLLSEEEAKEILTQLLNGFRGLHELFVIHRDLKLKNILVHNGQIKIADFGLSKVGEMGVTHVGTPYTKAPEVFKGRGRIRYTNKADIWSLGIIFYQLLFDLQYPFTGQSEQDLFNNIDKCREIDFQPKGTQIRISPNSKSLLSKMLQKDDKRRINWSDLYKDPYLGLKQNERSGFDPIFEEVMTQFQVSILCKLKLIRTLQSKILETLVNTEMLRTQHRTITNINTYYVQFIMSKRLVNLNFLLEKNITILQAKQGDFQMTAGFTTLTKEVEDTRLDYLDYYKLTLENLNQFIQRRVQKKRTYEIFIDVEIQNTRIQWDVYQQILLNYYFCLMDLAQVLETKNQTKTLQLLEHIVDLLKCLESDEEFQGEKLKQKSQSVGLERVTSEEEEKDSPEHAKQYLTIKNIKVDTHRLYSTKERINMMRKNIEELYQSVFFE